MKAVNTRRIRNWVISACIVLVTIEGAPYIISPILSGDSFSRKEISAALLQTTPDLQVAADQSDPNKEYLGKSIVHPYIGFVGHPRNDRNNFGFKGMEPIVKRLTDELNVCLMGGSVAYELYNTRDRLVSNLQKNAHFKDKKINVVLLALPGFKQPQQLMTLNYFMALGAEYDLVINLDGFNEVALPFSDNLPFNVFPSYPRHWNMLSRKKMNTVVLQYLGRQAFERRERSILRETFSESIMRYSNFGLMLWQSMDKKKSMTLYELEGKLRAAVLNSDKDYQSIGPQISVEDTTQYFEDLANLWRNTSVQMSALQGKSSFNYFHFLQPNQYVAGSKVLTEEEKSKAYESGPMDYKKAVENGYPHLVKKGRELVEMDVNYKDLTMLFQNEQESVYKDKCCHFNQHGYDRIVDSITEYILNHLQREKNTEIQ